MKLNGKYESSLGQVLSALADEGSVARHQLADLAGLTRATVTKAVQELIDHGIVIEIERAKGSARGGPRPILLEIRADAFHVIGLDIRREKITGCRVDLAGTVVKNATASLSRSVSPDGLTEALYTVVDTLCEGQDIPLGAIGVGSVGPVDIATGRSLTEDFTALYDLPVCDLLTARYGVPATIRYGAMAAAYGEERIALEEHTDLKSIAFVVIDFWGIGLGLISGGEGWLTDHGGVGEVGHVTVDMGGRPCECGRRGCLIQYASGRAALKLRYAEAHSHSETMLPELARDAAAGGEVARQSLTEAGYYLGSAIVDIDRLLRPSRIVVGSSHEGMAEWYLRGVDSYIEEVRENSDFGALRDRIRPARKGSVAIAYGAATLQIKHFMRAPSRTLAILSALRKPDLAAREKEALTRS